MSTKAYYPRAEIGPGQVGFSKTRSIIEAPFYGNNVIKVNTLKEAYELAKNSPGTVVTDMPVYRGEEFGLEPDAKVLLFNDGSITGRYAPARRITGKPGVDTAALDKIVMDAVYDTRWKTMYHAEVFIGLDPEFMVKAHLLIPEGEENLLYNWMLNFQYMSTEYVKMYKNSKPVGDGKEPDIYIFSDPQWTGAPGQEKVCDPKCLCYFNTESNCAAILGMRYFGEHKKGTLTLAWAIANRNGYASCHGGQKEYLLPDGSKYVASVYGLSGSGKSTLMNVLGCLDIPTRGDYFLDGVDVRELSDKELSRIRNKQIGFIFQQYNLIQNLTVLENVELPLIYQGIDPIDRRELAIQALTRVGLADRAQHKPTQMSGGQQQRVAIARALAMRPEVMLFDEPTSALDPEMIGEVLEVMIDLAKQGMTMVVVSHEMSFIREVADKVLVLADGVIIEEGSPQEVFTNPRHERCRSFLSKIL